MLLFVIVKQLNLSLLKFCKIESFQFLKNIFFKKNIPFRTAFFGYCGNIQRLLLDHDSKRAIVLFENDDSAQTGLFFLKKYI